MDFWIYDPTHHTMRLPQVSQGLCTRGVISLPGILSSPLCLHNSYLSYRLHYPELLNGSTLLIICTYVPHLSYIVLTTKGILHFLVIVLMFVSPTRL